MKITLTKTFESRQDVDDFVRGRIGEIANDNKDHLIEITEAEGTKLSLSNSSKVFGISVKIK